MSRVVPLSIGLLIGLLIGSCKEPCTADGCAGCCDAMGECQLGTVVSACGKRGTMCGVCSAGATCTKQVCVAPDGGLVEDAGVQPQGCRLGSCAPDVCNLVSGACEAASSCDQAAAQPASCGSGHVCRGGTCADVLPPTCANFSTTAPPRVWNPTVSFGPVITSARAVSFAVTPDAGCPVGSTRVAVAELTAYDFMNRFAAGAVPRLYRYRENTTLTDVTADATSEAASADGRQGTVRVRICSPDTVTTVTHGFAFESGNGVCVTFTP